LRTRLRGGSRFPTRPPPLRRGPTRFVIDRSEDGAVHAGCVLEAGHRG
jgi:hypothetical protein